jgi:hypothetical protein
MAVLLDEDFDDLANGSSIAASNTSYSTVSGSPFTADTAVKKHGAASAKRVATSGAASLDYRPSTEITTFYRRFYIRPEAVPSANAVLMYGQGAAGYSFDIRVLTGGTLQLRNSTFSLIQNGTVALPLNEWSRIEVGVVNGTVTVRLFAGNAAVDSNTPTETISGNFAQTSMNQISLGGTNTSVWPINLDSDVIDNAGWVGPVPAAPVVPQVVMYDNGTAWVNVTDKIRYDNGTAWVPVTI